MGTILNAVGILIASLIGLLLKSKLTKELMDALKATMGLVLLLLSLGWFLRDFFVIEGVVIETRLDLEILIIMILGVLFGTLLKIDSFFQTLLHKIEKKYKLPPIAEGFITASLIFTVGAIAIIGVLNEVIDGDLTLLYVKTTLDAMTALMLASTLGLGVLFSSLSVLFYQGIVMIIALLFASAFNDQMILYISLIGNVMIVAIAFDFLNIKTFKVLNMLPAIVLAIMYGALS